jgi:ATP/ADP translocase
LPVMIERLIALLTGAKSGERAKTLFSFASVFLLLTSYYLVKPMRNSQFLKDFDANLMPFFFLLIPVLSLLLTQIYSFLYDYIKTYRLISYTYFFMIACKLFFLFGLSMGGKWATAFFYLWAATYFLLCNAVLWGCINSLYYSESAERCFGFISIGATSGGIVGAILSEYLASGPFRAWTLLVSALLMGLALLFMFLAIKTSDVVKVNTSAPTKADKKPIWSDFSYLWQHRYVRGIAAMVFALALLNTVMEFQWNKTIDLQAAQKQYLQDMKPLNLALNQQQNKPTQSLNPAGFALVRELKHVDKEAYAAKIEIFLKTQQIPLSTPDLISAYTRYRDNLEAETRRLISSINKYQGIVGVLLLIFAARPLYRWVGVRWVLVSLPLLFALVTLGMFFPVELMTVVWMQTGTYALNYSLYRTSKELLYTQTDNETRFKLKPLIEGPIMRLGDVTASILKLSLIGVMVLLLGMAESQLDQVYLVFALVIIGFWLYEAWGVGSRYEALRRKESKASK